MNSSLRIYLHSMLLYSATALLSLVAVWRHIAGPSTPSGIGPLELTLENGLIFVVVFATFTFVMVRFVRVAHASLTFLLGVALIAGAQFIFASWMPMPWDIVAGVGVAVLVWVLPRVLIHDLAIMIGIGGIAGVLGLSMTPLVASALLALLSVYDIVSVYRTRHMVALAGRMLESGAVFGFLVPARVSGFWTRRDDALKAQSVMMLGSGDIGLPLVLAASAVSQSIGASVCIIAGALVGVTAMHWLFSHQYRSAPMAALPPIAVSAILGYAVAIALGI
jgi:presenilin-like A22 family membrane protease